MTGTQLGEILLELSILFGTTFFLARPLTRLRIPGILGALFVAMGAHYTPIGSRLLSPDLYPSLDFLAQLGVMFLLFYIGMEIDLKEMRRSGKDIILCTVTNTVTPFLLGIAVMLAMGYDLLISFVIGLTLMPTAEAVIVPMLDEFKLIRTRVGQFIVGVGTLDDVIEVFIVALVSIWIGEKAAVGAVSLESEFTGILLTITIFIALTFFCYRWIIPYLRNWLPDTPVNLILLSMFVMFALSGVAEFGGLGMVVGSITAGVLMSPLFQNESDTAHKAMQTIRSISYGFLGLVFFFWVGLSVDIAAIAHAPMLAILLYLAGTIGKLLGVFMLVPMGKLNVKEAGVIGVGLNARLTTEIIVAKLLLDAKIIDTELFTALVTAASFTAVTVPLAFTILVRIWGERLTGSKLESDPM